MLVTHKTFQLLRNSIQGKLVHKFTFQVHFIVNLGQRQLIVMHIHF